MNRPADPRPVWRAIVTNGGLMPVSDVERARFKRVRATFRAVWGLSPDASDDELADAWLADRRSVRQMAGLYMADYAARLNPNDPALDDIDRAALPWRDAHTEAEPEPETYDQPELIPGRWAALLTGRIASADL